MFDTLLIWPCYILLGLLLADFASGLIHWIIDRYCEPDMPVAGKHFVGLIHEHHRMPLAMFRLGIIRRNAGFVILVGSLFLIFLAFGWINPVTGSAFFFGALANQVHCWAHRRPRRLAFIIRPLQKTGLLQSARHHGVHHGPCPDRHYCLITNYVNPLVDSIDLWHRGERALMLIGIRPKDYVLPNPAYRAMEDVCREV